MAGVVEDWDARASSSARPGGLYAYLWGLQSGRRRSPHDAQSDGGQRRAHPVRRGAKPATLRALARLRTPGANLSDREFLAPALEILETPPSPIHVAFLWTICAFVLAALVWAYLGHVDIVAAAQGKFQPTGRVKVVEPLETGRVEDIRVANGSLVKAGDVLIELDRASANPMSRARAPNFPPHGRKSCAARPRLLRRKRTHSIRRRKSTGPTASRRVYASARSRFSPPISGN